MLKSRIALFATLTLVGVVFLISSFIPANWELTNISATSNRTEDSYGSYSAIPPDSLDDATLDEAIPDSLDDAPLVELIPKSLEMVKSPTPPQQTAMSVKEIVELINDILQKLIGLVMSFGGVILMIIEIKRRRRELEEKQKAQLVV